ncbi:UpxY family transcription antiterminator [Aureibaculum sp. 2210JD6-5]|uniref:UpxY family transcription antiterminator n=1 Tax=Aureibaculum sp. 2210JD6-5 TaxID=3103957 RepID=UPI002AACEC3F|nr:UpxY family transcription antiterminator [Aureibaculum sp. 2210JD6-5]MDY7394016.1 UpxY family transcription antiterminator [Aureibaculum sp. 2210JD6-5]
MSTSNSKNWYAVYTRSNAEKKVCEQLRRSRYTTYLPLVTTFRQWSDRKKKVQIPLIPSYVFVRIEEQNVHKVLAVNGALHILKYLGKYAIVKEEEIKNLQLLISGESKSQFSLIENISRGDEVEVIKGLFIGLRGYFVKEKNKQKVFIKINALNRYVGIEIPHHNIKRLESKTKIYNKKDKILFN